MDILFCCINTKDNQYCSIGGMYIAGKYSCPSLCAILFMCVYYGVEDDKKQRIRYYNSDYSVRVYIIYAHAMLIRVYHCP